MNIKVIELLAKAEKYRIKQLEQAFYKNSEINVEKVSVLSKPLRSQILELGNLLSFKVSSQKESKDGTIKCLFELFDGKVVEAVLMVYKSKEKKFRNTLCISSQAGCAMNCSFCATGKLGLGRNLTNNEIADQVVYFNHLLKNKYNKDDIRVDNVVFMGMGEPMNNYDEVMKSVDIIISKIGIGARHITISTCGIVPYIYKLAEQDYQVNLAISLHSPYDEQRSQIMPINKGYPIEELLKSVEYYIKQTNRRVSFEYIMLGDMNDSLEAAEDLAHLLEPLRLVHVNCIPYNPTYAENGAVIYKQSSNNHIHRFVDKLKDYGVSATIRQNKGRDIDGACGQLAAKSLLKSAKI